MEVWHRAVVVVLCQLSAVGCGDPSKLAGPDTSRHPSTSGSSLDPNQVIMPAPTRASPTRSGTESGADADDGSAGRGRAVPDGSAGVGRGLGGGRGGSGIANAGTAGSQQPAGAAAAGVNAAANASGAGAIAGATAEAQGDPAGRGTGGSEAGSAAHGASSGSGGDRASGAGRGAAGMRGPAGTGGSNVTNFSALIDKLSNALTAEQRNRIVLGLQTNSVTPDQLNELLDAVTRAGACESDHETCQQMCTLVLSACPTCTIDSMSTEAERARCAAL